MSWPHTNPHRHLAFLLAYNASFFALHFTGQARVWKDALNDLQATLSIMELMAVVALFVDLVVRYDNIPKTWQTSCHRRGLCVTGLLFKWFILYLDHDGDGGQIP